MAAGLDRPVEVVLHLDDAVGCDRDQHVVRAGRGRLLDHDAGLGVRAGVGLRRHPGDDRAVAVAGERLVHVVELVVGAPDVGPGTVHGEHAVGVAGRAGDRG